MEDIILLDSKGTKFLKKLMKKDGAESKTYVLKTSDTTLRSGITDSGNKFISLHRGPTIIENEIFKDALVKTIDFVENYGFTVTFY